MFGKTIRIATGLSAASLVALTAHAETRDFDLEAFNAIKIAQGMEAFVTIGEKQSVSVDGPDGKMDGVDIYVKGETLFIRRAKKKNGWGWGRNVSNFTVNVVATQLSSVDASSGSDISVSGVKASNFAIDASSGANIEISGTCSAISADASSGSDIEAEDLVCQTGSADVSSGADISLHVSETFAGDASSGGNIDVYGDPTTVTTDESSGGDIDLR